MPEMQKLLVDVEAVSAVDAAEQAAVLAGLMPDECRMVDSGEDRFELYWYADGTCAASVAAEPDESVRDLYAVQILMPVCRSVRVAARTYRDIAADEINWRTAESAMPVKVFAETVRDLAGRSLQYGGRIVSARPVQEWRDEMSGDDAYIEYTCSVLANRAGCEAHCMNLAVVTHQRMCRAANPTKDAAYYVQVAEHAATQEGLDVTVQDTPFTYRVSVQSRGGSVETNLVPRDWNGDPKRIETVHRMIWPQDERAYAAVHAFTEAALAAGTGRSGVVIPFPDAGYGQSGRGRHGNKQRA